MMKKESILSNPVDGVTERAGKSGPSRYSGICTMRASPSMLVYGALRWIRLTVRMVLRAGVDVTLSFNPGLYRTNGETDGHILSPHSALAAAAFHEVRVCLSMPMTCNDFSCPAQGGVQDDITVPQVERRSVTI